MQYLVSLGCLREAKPPRAGGEKESFRGKAYEGGRVGRKTYIKKGEGMGATP